MSKRNASLIVLIALLLLGKAAILHAEWFAGGVPICTDTLPQTDPRMTSDGAGGAYISWADYRGGYSSWDIYAQRVDAQGNIRLMPNGIPVCAAPGKQYNQEMIPDGSGGAIILWVDLRASIEIYAQRIDSTGALRWTPDGILIGIANYHWPPHLIPDGDGGAIIACSRPSGAGTGYDIWAYRIDANGNPCWEDGRAIVCNAPFDQINVQLTSDGAGGAILAWEDLRSAISGRIDIYARRITAGGDLLWLEDGVPIRVDAEGQHCPELAPDGAGGAIITWHGDSPDSGHNVFAQRVDANGVVLWASDGIAVCTTGNDQEYPLIMPDGAGGAYIAWTHNLAWSVGDIYAERIDSNGASLWASNGIPIAVVSNDQQYPRIAPDGVGGVLVTWQDERLWDDDIYLQRISANGIACCPANGIPVCNAADLQFEPRIVAAGPECAIIAWGDKRSGNADIYAVKMQGCELPVSTFLRNFLAVPSPDGISIRWALTAFKESMRLHLLRAEVPSGAFTAIANPAIREEGLTFSFHDEDVRPGSSYRYRVEVSDESGQRVVLFETDAIAVSAPAATLCQNRPNPFNPSTTIEYSIAQDAHVNVTIFDLRGRHVRTLVDEFLKCDTYRVVWDGTDSRGDAVASGVYFCRLKLPAFNHARKLVLLK